MLERLFEVFACYAGWMLVFTTATRASPSRPSLDDALRNATIGFGLIGGIPAVFYILFGDAVF